MDEELIKYIVGELTPEEKEKFLLEVEKREEMREEWLDAHNLFVLVGWALAEDEDGTARRKLPDFLDRMDKRKNR